MAILTAAVRSYPRKVPDGSGLAVEVRGLAKSYGSLPAVRGIELAIERGEIFALLGPNGAGKTTTVEILEGYRSRDAGYLGTAFSWTDVLVVAAWGLAGMLLAIRFFSWEPRAG